MSKFEFYIGCFYGNCCKLIGFEDLCFLLDREDRNENESEEKRNGSGIYM